jgi:hypothetical protein
MISDGCPDADREVLVKGVGEHLLPSAQALGTWAAWLGGSGSETVISTCSAISGQVRAWSRSSRICCVEAG